MGAHYHTRAPEVRPSSRRHPSSATALAGLRSNAHAGRCASPRGPDLRRRAGLGCRFRVSSQASCGRCAQRVQGSLEREVSSLPSFAQRPLSDRATAAYSTAWAPWYNEDRCACWSALPRRCPASPRGRPATGRQLTPGGPWRSSHPSAIGLRNHAPARTASEPSTEAGARWGLDHLAVPNVPHGTAMRDAPA